LHTSGSADKRVWSKDEMVIKLKKFGENYAPVPLHPKLTTPGTEMGIHSEKLVFKCLRFNN
jgi:hypothetical protein